MAETAGAATAVAAPSLELRGVVKRFGEVAAVDEVSLAIAASEFFALLGPSGCGKSTLLRLIAGFEQPDAGAIRIGGRDMAGVPPYARPVNMMFQSYALFPHMTVERNIAFGLEQEKLPRAEIADRVAAMLELVQMGKLAQRKPHQLSGGQRQRVALARALAKRPSVLLLDEPLAALDRKLREETRLELAALQRRLGTTFVLVTHDQDEAMTMADRIAVMNHGRIEQVGPPAEVYENPKSRFVAEFLGDANLFAGVVGACGGGVVALDTEDAGRLAAWGEGWPVGAGAVLAVRPEKVRLAAAGEAHGDGAHNRLRGEVVDTAYLGDISIAHIRLASGRTVLASIANQRRAERQTIGRGARVELSWDAESGILLPH